uniref:Uncharacterized protein n=1 Tax=Phakopsora pachyrhizi TaxID=170000 RepID=A0A0S1MJB5_PHAPC
MCTESVVVCLILCLNRLVDRSCCEVMDKFEGSVSCLSLIKLD